MKFKEIKPGKKYYHSHATNHEDKQNRAQVRAKIRETKTIYVLEVRTKEAVVIASIGGAPAQTFTKDKYSRWRDTPEEAVKSSMNLNQQKIKAKKEWINK